MKPGSNNQLFRFGKRLPFGPLAAADVPELLAEARRRESQAAQTPIENILSILDKVADLWADQRHPLVERARKELPGLVKFSLPMVDEGLHALVHLCRRENLEKRLKGEIGGKNLLDGWTEKEGLGFELMAAPRGTILHLSAGNVFVGAIDSLVSGIITKNVNIMKMSHVDPLFPGLFMESLLECDPQGIIWPNQAILSWKGGDAEVEKPMLGSDLTVVFWGGREALAAVKTKIGPETRLVENGPRYSFAVADARILEETESEAAVEGLCRDLCMWDQQACSSPHVVYVVGPNDRTVFQLMDRMFPHLERISKELPLGSLDFDEKVEIRKVRELATMAEVKGSGRVVCPDAFSFSLIFEASPRFKVSCLNRTLFFKRVPTLDDLMEQILPLSSFLQTVGILLRGDQRGEFERRVLRAGAKRLTGWGGMSVGFDGAPHEGSFLLSNLVDWVDREPLGSGEGRLERLKAEISRSPYYRGVLAKTAEKGGRFKDLPLLDRPTFYRNSPPVSRDILTGPLTNAYVYASGGTTGEPKFTFYSNPEWVRTCEIMSFIYRTAGITKDDVVGNLFLAGNLWTSFSVAARAVEMIGCLNLPIGGGADFENMIKYIRAYKVNAIVGLPSIIVKLAEEIQQKGLELKIQKILYGGEHVRPQTEAFLKKVLKCEWVRSAGYALVDTGPVGYQCPHLAGTNHHVLEDVQFLEILDESGNPGPVNPETGFGLPGEIVATNLYRHLMPVVRYRTGDMGRWTLIKNCPCGFRGATFELLGRCDDMLVIGGINLLPSDVAAGLAKIPVSPNFQMVGRTKGEKDLLHLRLEAERPLPEAQVISALREGSYKLEGAIRDGWLLVEVEWFSHGAIPRNPRTGKLKISIDERG